VLGAKKGPVKSTWLAIAHHNVGFRQSDRYQKWRGLLNHFYDPFPLVEHYCEVLPMYIWWKESAGEFAHGRARKRQANRSRRQQCDTQFWELAGSAD
jgi:hypothetical protein